MEREREDRLLEWLKAVGVPLAVAVGSLAIGVTTVLVQQRNDDRQVEALYVQLAIDLLSAEPLPVPETGDDPNEQRRPLKQWAFRLLSESSPTEIPEDLRELYEQGESPPVLLPGGFRCNVDTDGDGVNDSYRLGTLTLPSCTNSLALQPILFCNVDTDGDGVADIYRSTDPDSDLELTFCRRV